jgi:ABC-2 type transport system ATP-binding protein
VSGGVLAEGVHVRFGAVHALDGVDITAPAGSTLGVLGHNGAGKTTLIRVLTTLIRPEAGFALVDGHDVVRHPDRVRHRIGVTGQYAGLDEFLTGRENVELIARLAGLGTAAGRRTDELVERLDLGEIADRRVGTLSGGSRRRIDLAVSLIAEPAVLFLDEPTTGLDPNARAGLWDVIEELNDIGTTVVLTTQYLEEADRLADEIAVLDHGRVVANGTPSDLKRLVGGKIVTATLSAAQLDQLPRPPEAVTSADDGAVRVTYSADCGREAAALVAHLSAHTALTDLDVTSPTLDDVFAHLTAPGART